MCPSDAQGSFYRGSVIHDVHIRMWIIRGEMSLLALFQALDLENSVQGQVDDVHQMRKGHFIGGQ